jgi:hypothetical protein
LQAPTAEEGKAGAISRLTVEAEEHPAPTYMLKSLGDLARREELRLEMILL